MTTLAPSEESFSARREAFAELKHRLQAGLGSVRASIDLCVPSALPALDEMLGGGFPRGTLTTLEGPGSSGRWSIAARLLAQATQRGLAAVVDEGELYPPDLAQAGVRLERLLVVPARTALGVARAADILTRSRACRVIVMPAPPLRAAVWSRLAGLAHRAGALLVVVTPRAPGELASAATVRLQCVRERVSMFGTRGVWCTFAGFEFRAELRKHKRAVTGTHARLRAVVHDDRTPYRERPIVERSTRSAAGSAGW
jgi:hypothetical protein